MMKLIAFVAALFAAVPALAQSPVYTNRDLSPHQVTWNRQVTAEELASLKSREFKLPPRYDGPTVFYFGTAQEPQPLSPYRPLSEPFIAPYYYGWSSVGYGSPYGYGYSRGLRSTDRVRGASQPPADSISPHRPERPVKLPHSAPAVGGARARQ
jgi:hypothetical protein